MGILSSVLLEYKAMFVTVHSRLVKHTGYGNAAGLLARRGLMLGGRGGNYSSDEESDTEEYKEVRHQVNPITASIDEPRVNPLEVSQPWSVKGACSGGVCVRRA